MLGGESGIWGCLDDDAFGPLCQHTEPAGKGVSESALSKLDKSPTRLAGYITLKSALRTSRLYKLRVCLLLV